MRVEIKKIDKKRVDITAPSKYVIEYKDKVIVIIPHGAVETNKPAISECINKILALMMLKISGLSEEIGKEKIDELIKKLKTECDIENIDEALNL